MSFIRRYGRGHRRDEQLARDEVPESLKVGLLALVARLRGQGFVTWGAARESICHALRRRPDPSNWSEFPNVHDEVESIVYNSAWDEFYTICEALNDACNVVRLYEDQLNSLLEEEASPWRVTDGEIGPAFPEEVEQVLQEASGAAQRMERPGAAVHLDKARRYLSPTSGDKENAVKEAVSALEAAVKAKSGLDDFDDGLKLLKQQRLLVGAWPSAVQALYQYASQEDQVRHGSPQVSDLTYEEARDLVGLAAVLMQHIVDLRDPVHAG